MPLAGLTLAELAARLGGDVFGDAGVCIRRVNTLEKAGEGEIAFFANPKYQQQLRDTRAAAVLLSPRTAELAGERPAIIVPDPYLAFARVAQWLDDTPRPQPGVHASAVCESPLPASVHVGAQVWIGPDVTLGENVTLEAGCMIGRGVSIGAGSHLYPRVTVYHDCVLGERAIVHSGAVIGADGFGFARHRDGRWEKIPQTGRVVIGNDVEIGANTTIDRGALDDTEIGDDVKLDNQIQVAHNVRIGAHTAIAGCVGIAGSTRIGERCLIGGQAGIIGHLTICDDVIISAGTLVTKSIHKPGTYTANLPVQGHADWVRNFAHLRNLDALADRLRGLERQLAAGDAVDAP